jgi:hypothetical protein
LCTPGLRLIVENGPPAFHPSSISARLTGRAARDRLALGNSTKGSPKANRGNKRSLEELGVSDVHRKNKPQHRSASIHVDTNAYSKGIIYYPI